MSLRKKARKVGGHTVVEQGARIGYAASGVLHLLLAWLALRLAWGNPEQEADQSGAFETLALHPAGVTLLAVLGTGFVLLGAWNLLEAAVPHGAADRGKFLATGVTYGVLAWGAYEVAGGRDTSSSEQTQDITAVLLSNAFGTALVVLIGAVVLAVGGYHVFKGLAGTYRDDLSEDPGRTIEVTGTIGYVAKGMALLVIGGLFWAAVITHDPDKASGMDGALRTLLGLPQGRILLTVVALGLLAFGIYSLGRGRYAKV